MELDCTQKLNDCVYETFIDDVERKTEVGFLEINGLKHPLFIGENRVGRDSITCSICIDNKVISKQHAVLELGQSSDDNLIYDLQSCNKTRLGNLVMKPLVQYHLRNNAHIMFGNLSTTFCRIPIPDSGTKGDDKESGTIFECEKLTNNMVYIDGAEYDIHEAPTQYECDVSKCDEPESVNMQQLSAKYHSKAEVCSANVLQKTKNIATIESGICGNNMYELQTQIFQELPGDTFEKSLGEAAVNKEDLNIEDKEKNENIPKADAYSDIFDLPTQMVSVAKSTPVSCGQHSDTENSSKSKNKYESNIDVKNNSRLLSVHTSAMKLNKNISNTDKLLSSPKFGTTITHINEDSGDRSLLEGDEDMFEISMNGPLPCNDSVGVISAQIKSDKLANDSKHSSHNISENGLMTEALDISGIQSMIKSDSSGDETDPDDLFIGSSKKLISSNPKVSFKSIEPDKILKGKNVSSSGNLDNWNSDPGSNDETDPEDIFCASTQKINGKLLQLNSKKKQMLNTSKSDESTDMDDILCSATQKFNNTPRLGCTVAATPDKDSSVCSKTSEKVIMEDSDILSAPTQICDSQMFKTSMKCNMGNLSKVTSCKTDECKSERILQECPNILKHNLLVVPESDTTCETSDIFSVPTQKILIEEATRNVDNLKDKQKISEKNVKNLDNSVLVEAEDCNTTSDTSDIFIAPTQKISIEKVLEVGRDTKKDNVEEEKYCGILDNHLRAKLSDKLISQGFESEDDDNNIFSAPTQNISKLKVENKYKNPATSENEQITFEYSGGVSGNMRIIEKDNCFVNDNEKSTEYKKITTLENREQGDSGTDLSDISLAPTQIIKHNFQGNIGNIKFGANVNVARYEEEIIGSSAALEETETGKLEDLGHPASSKNGLERTSANTEVNEVLKKKLSSGIKHQEIIANRENEENFLNIENTSRDSVSSLELPSSSECSSVSKELQTTQKNANSKKDTISLSKIKRVIKKSRKSNVVVVSNEDACYSEEKDTQILRSKVLKKCRNDLFHDTNPLEKSKKLETEEKINENVIVTDTEIAFNETSTPQKQKIAPEYKESTQCGLVSPILSTRSSGECKMALEQVKSHCDSQNIKSCNDGKRIMKPAPFLGTVNDLFQEITAAPYNSFVRNVVKYKADVKNKEISEEFNKSSATDDNLKIRQVSVSKISGIEFATSDDVAKSIPEIASRVTEDTSDSHDHVKSNKMSSEAIESVSKHNVQPTRQRHSSKILQINDQHLTTVKITTDAIAVVNQKLESTSVLNNTDCNKCGVEECSDNSRKSSAEMQYNRKKQNHTSNSKQTQPTDLQQSPAKTHSKRGKRQSKEEEYVAGEECVTQNKRSRRRTSAVQYCRETNKSSNSKLPEPDVEEPNDKTSNNTGKRKSTEEIFLRKMQIDNICEKSVVEEKVTSNKRRRRGTTAVEFSRETNKSSNSKPTEPDMEESPKNTLKRKSKEEILLSEMQMDNIRKQSVGEEKVTLNKRSRRGTTAVEFSRETNQSSNSKLPEPEEKGSHDKTPKNTGKRKSTEEIFLRKMQIDNICEKSVVEEKVTSNKRSRRGTTAVEFSRETNKSSNSKQTEPDMEESPKNTGKRKSKEEILLSEMQMDNICKQSVGEEKVTSNKRSRRGTSAVEFSRETNQSSNSKQTELTHMDESHTKSLKNTGTKCSKEKKLLGSVSNEMQNTDCEIYDQGDDDISNKRSRRCSYVANYSRKCKQSPNAKQTTLTDVEQSHTVIQVNTSKRQRKQEKLLNTVPIDVNSNIGNVEEENQISKNGRGSYCRNLKEKPNLKQTELPIDSTRGRPNTRSGTNSNKISSNKNSSSKDYVDKGQDIINEEVPLKTTAKDKSSVTEISREVSGKRKQKSSKNVQGIVTNEQRKSMPTKRKVEYANPTMNKEESYPQAPPGKDTRTIASMPEERKNISDPSLDCLSPSRHSTRTLRKLEWHVMFSKYNDRKLESSINRLGGMVTEEPNECTVLVTDKVRRTYKFLCVIGQGKPIVKPEWVQESQEAKAFLDPWDYLLTDEEAEKKYQFSLKKSLMLARENRFLLDYTVLSTPKVLPPPEEMKGIVEMCGGKFVKNVTGELPEKSFIISCEADNAKWNKLRKLNRPIVSVDVLLLGVLQQHLDINAYIL